MIWPFFPNWASAYRETFAYLTEIITSDEGREQRRAWRQAARRTITYSALVHKDRFQAFRRVMAQQQESLTFPDERTRVSLPLAAPAGLTVDFGTAFAPWLATGQQVFFEVRKTRARTLRTVDSVAGSVVTFSEPTGSWSAGTRVMPAFVGRAGQNLRINAITGGVANVAVELDVEPGTEIEMPGAPATVFNGREVLTHRPNWSSPVQIEAIDPTEWSDNQIGVRTPYVAIPFGTEVYQSDHTIRSSTELDQVLGLFQRCRGRCGEFYAPTWTNDIVFTALPAVGQKVFAVAGHDFYDAYAGDLVRRGFMLRTNLDDRFYFLISSMAKSTSGAPRTLITVATGPSETLSLDDVALVSWLPVCRFANDEMTVTWQTDRLASITLNIQSTENLL